MDPGSDESPRLDAERFAAIQLDLRALMRMAEEARARAQATREQIRQGAARCQHG